MTKHRPTTVRSPQWWKHLRDWKRVFWKRDRQQAKRDLRKDQTC
jgi:hypothetical protein